MNDSDRKMFEKLFRDFPELTKVSAREVDYLDIAPEPFEIQIPLVEYFERVKRLKADRWQHDFCERLQSATLNQHVESTRAVVHAEGQLGKSVILAQCFPAWLLAHNPLYRFALATYNVTRSQSHSKAVIDIMNLPVHREIFPDKAGWVKANVAKTGWQTAARSESTDSQLSYNPVGLNAGLTGSGFDCLTGDARLQTDRGIVSIDKVVSERPGKYKVLAYDKSKFGPVWGHVLAVRKVRRNELVRLTFHNSHRDGKTVLTSTPEHRISTPIRGYVNARDLRLGDAVGAEGIEEDIVVGIEFLDSTNQWVYDVQVEKYENFFAEGILVHNCLIIDDPYASQQEAFSDTIRLNLQQFWDFTVLSRAGLLSNIIAMFHRYHINDLGGYLLDTGDFDYWRYASMFDEPYVHDETGRIYPDPLDRAPGEYISPDRRPPEYYEKARKNPRVWTSMFQGRPSAVEGEFFKVGLIDHVDARRGAELFGECVSLVRAWDNAATSKEKGSGDHTCGGLMGIRPDGTVVVFDVVLDQLDSGERVKLQRTTAENDGQKTTVCIPADPASAGKDTVFFTKQALKGFTVETRPTTQNKLQRALDFSAAVNSGEVTFVEGEWNKQVTRSLRDFPLSDFDDPVDALSDAYNYLFSQFKRGRVIEAFDSRYSLMTWRDFASRFGNCDRIPANFTVYAGLKVTADASEPNSACIVARAPENAHLPDTLFVVAEYKQWTADYQHLFDWMDTALEAYCESGARTTIWLHKDSAQFAQTIWQKFAKPVAVFDHEATAGLAELNWHLKPIEERNPFTGADKTCRMFGLIHDYSQLNDPRDELGLYAFRQEAVTWGFDDKGEPTAIGAVLDCARMVTHCFKTSATPLNREERIEARLDPALRATNIAAMDNSPERDALLTRRNIEVVKARREVDTPIRGPHASRFSRR